MRPPESPSGIGLNKLTCHLPLFVLNLVVNAGGRLTLHRNIAVSIRDQFVISVKIGAGVLFGTEAVEIKIGRVGKIADRTRVALG